MGGFRCEPLTAIWDGAVKSLLLDSAEYIKSLWWFPCSYYSRIHYRQSSVVEAKTNHSVNNSIIIGPEMDQIVMYWILMHGAEVLYKYIQKYISVPKDNTNLHKMLALFSYSKFPIWAKLWNTAESAETRQITENISVQYWERVNKQCQPWWSCSDEFQEMEGGRKNDETFTPDSLLGNFHLSTAFCVQMYLMNDTMLDSSLKKWNISIFKQFRGLSKCLTWSLQTDCYMGQRKPSYSDLKLWTIKHDIGASWHHQGMAVPHHISKQGDRSQCEQQCFGSFNG